MKKDDKEIQLLRLALLDTINEANLRTGIVVATVTELATDFWMANTNNHKEIALEGLSQCINTLMTKKYR